MSKMGANGLKSAKAIDLSSNARVPVLIDLMRTLSETEDPNHAYRTFFNAMTEVFPSKAFIGISTEGVGPGEFRVMQLVDHNKKIETDTSPFSKEEQEQTSRRGGLIGEILDRGVPQLINSIRIRKDPAMGDFLIPYRSLMAVPIFERGESRRWGIILDRRESAFDENDFEWFFMRVNMIGAFLRNIVTSRQLRLAADLSHKEIQRIAAIQRSLLPQTLPEIPGVNLAVSYETFDQAGGDLYDLHQIGTGPDGMGSKENRWAVVIGDVSGHGPAAAVVMAMVEAMLMSRPAEEESPAKILDFLNTRLCHKRIENSFVTAIAAIYDQDTHEMRYSCAGHPPILLRRPCGKEVCIDHLDAIGGPPLAVVPELKYEETRIKLVPGQTLTFYTDGITEARGPESKFFWVDGIERALRACNGDAYCVVESVMGELKKHEAGGRPLDDQTLLAMEILG